MKKLIVLLSIVLLLMTSCYFSNFEEYTLTVTDNGPLLSDRTKHVITVKAPDGYSDIRYTVDGSNPTGKSDAFSPSSLQASDTLSYEGMLVNEETVFKVAAFKGDNRTFIASVKVEKIVSSIPTFTSNGVLASDTTRCIFALSVDDNSSIYYTTDGSDPRTAGTEYVENTYLNDDGESVRGTLFEAGVTVKAASKKGNAWSDVAEAIAYSTSQKGIKFESQGELLGDSTQQIIQISSAFENPEIYYTLDSSSPKSSGILYSGKDYTNSEGKTVNGLLVGVGVTVTAYAKAQDILSVEKSYVVRSPEELKPVMVNHGSNKSDRAYQIVELKTEGTYAKIYYTTDGTDPRLGELYTPSSYTVYSGEIHSGISISPTSKFRAIAVDGLLFSTELKTSIESTSSWAPVIENTGNYNGSDSRRTIKITSSASSASIYYTTDGTNPKEGKLYDSSYIVVDAGCTVRAVAKKGDVYSEESQLVVRALVSWTPTITYYGPSSESSGKEVVSISTYYNGYSIYYTVDGSEPYDGTAYEPYECKYYSSSSSTSTVKGILVKSGTTIRAVACYNDTYSGIAEMNVDYKTQILPVIKDKGTSRSDPSKRVIIISCSNDDASIYYTLDGTDPVTNGTQYSPVSLYTSDYNYYYGILVPSGTEIKVVAKLWDRYSDVVSIDVCSPSELKPGYTGLGIDASNENRVIISLSCIDESAEILYTTDDTNPKDYGKKYVSTRYILSDGTTAEGISIPYGTKVRAVARRSGIYSDEFSRTVSAPAPKITDYGLLKEDAGKVVIRFSGAVSNSSIYYTIDDTDPKTNGKIYTEEPYRCSDDKDRMGIKVGNGTTLRAVTKIGDTYSEEFSQVIYVPSLWTPRVSNLCGAKDREGYQIISISPRDSTDSVYYTTDGSDPRTNGILYSAEGYLNAAGETCNGILASVGSTVKACSKEGCMFSDVVELTVTDTLSWAPKIVNNGGIRNSSGYQVVSISTTDTGSDTKIYYATLSNTNLRSGGGTQYSPKSFTLGSGETREGVSISSGSTIWAVTKKGDAYSDVTKLYITDTTSWAPEVTWMGTYFFDNAYAVVRMTTTEDDALIYYTTAENGDPKTGVLYTKDGQTCEDGKINYPGIQVKYGTTLRCITKKTTDDGVTYSDVVVLTISQSLATVNTAAGSSTDYRWERYPSYDVSDCICYKSNNKSVSNSKAVMKITFSGCSSFTIYIRSYAQMSSDYAIASTVDASTIPTSYSSDNVKVTTRNNQSSGTSLSYYTQVKYDGLTTGEHSIYVVFVKDGSNNSYDDCGYVLIPSSYLT